MQVGLGLCTIGVMTVGHLTPVVAVVLIITRRQHVTVIGSAV